MTTEEAEAAADLAESEREHRADESRKNEILERWDAQKTHLGVFAQGGVIEYEGHDTSGLRFVLRASRTTPAFLQIQLTPAEALAWGKVLARSVDEHEREFEH